jgi:hypothetical protein
MTYSCLIPLFSVKLIGLGCLGAGFIFLVLWSLVWVVAAEMADKDKVLMARPSPLGFQRL